MRPRGSAGGLVDVTLLDERLYAEAPRRQTAEPAEADRGPSVAGATCTGGGTAAVASSVAPVVRFDLDGVGKGWIADRALALLADLPSALVDADGDIALQVAPGSDWEVAMADPRTSERSSRTSASAIVGHPDHGRRDVRDQRPPLGAVGRRSAPSHRSTDPPARDDRLSQATVVAEDATTAEGLAKSAVIAGSDAAPDLLERAGALAAVLLLDDGDVIASPSTVAWLVP